MLQEENTETQAEPVSQEDEERDPNRELFFDLLAEMRLR